VEKRGIEKSAAFTHEGKAADFCEAKPSRLVLRIFLLAQTESLDDGTVTLDVLALEVVEQSPSLAYKFYE